MTWTPDELPDLTGTTAVVTGGNSGIGFVTARELAGHGATVILACRNIAAAEQSAERIRSNHNGTGARIPDVRVAELDLSSLISVRRFADSWESPLDLLVNNAGVMAPRSWQGTRDGFELQFGTNHLGHFALTGLLLPALSASALPRVVTVSSIAHHGGRTDLLDGNPPGAYRPDSSYSNSKLANLLFGAELARRATANGSAVTSTMAHPGVCATGLAVDPQGLGSYRAVRLLAPLVMRVAFQSAAAGARPSLYASVAEPGSYTGPQWLRESRGPVGPARWSALAKDHLLAARLWQVSQDLTGVEYSW